MSRDNQLVRKFNGLLVDYLNTFNLLELNVGLCVRFLSSLDTEDANKKLEKMSFEKKLEQLLDLTASENGSEIHKWCEEAHAKRHERNMYMHGQWEFFPHLDESVEFSIAPWVKEKYSSIYPGNRFSLQKLESIVLDIKASFQQLMLLRRKYGI